MRIWIVNHYAIPPSQPGGTRHYSLAAELIRRGHEVLIIAANFNYSTRTETKAQSEEFVYEVVGDDVPFLWVKVPEYHDNSPARIWNMLSFAGRVGKLKRYDRIASPEVVIGSSPHLFAAWAAERLARSYKVPFILEVRDIWPQSLIELGGISPYHPFLLAMKYLERYLYQNAKRIITLLPGAIGYFLEEGIAETKIFWIPNGIDLHLLSVPVPPLETETFTIIYAGAHGLANGLDTVLEAAKILQEEGLPVAFKLVGDGPEKVRLRERAQNMELANVSFEDPVPKKHVHKKIQEADAGLMILKSSDVFKWGVSPNKLFDYLAMARPVIFGVNSVNDPIKDSKAGISVTPEDPVAIVDAIEKLMDMSPKERWDMGRRGRSYVERNHGFAQLVDILEKVLVFE